MPNDRREHSLRSAVWAPTRVGRVISQEASHGLIVRPFSPSILPGVWLKLFEHSGTESTEEEAASLL